MDSYDIFKKLTVGVKFKTKKRLNQTTAVKKTQDFVSIRTDDVDKSKEIKQEQNNDEETSITLLGNISTNPRKRKKTKELTEEKKQMLKQEEINHYRNLNSIHVTGRHVPEPIKSFSELNVGNDLLENIQNCGYNEPTPIQKQAIPIMMQKRQLLACAPTGSGKTAAFLIPIIHDLGHGNKDGCRTLIITPTRELAKQIQRECISLCQTRGLRTYFIKKVTNNPDQFRNKGIKKIDILITTPNRLCFFLTQEPCPLSLSKVQWLIIDEADKLFETGVRCFRYQLLQILEACNNDKRRIAMFSATHTPAVAFWARHNMKGLITLIVGQRNAAATTLDQELLFVGNEQGKLIAMRDLIRKGFNPPVLVFVQSKERAQQLFSELIYDGINVDIIHSDRTQLQRDNTVRAFREGRIWVLICTELMARGIDFKGVNLVINYDFPQSSISYIHRVGRAGRAGRPGKAITFFTTDDTVNLRSIVQILKQSGCDVPEYMLKMKKRGKKHRKRLLVSAPKREDITTDFVLKKRKKQKLKDKEKKNTKNSGNERENTKNNAFKRKTNNVEYNSAKVKRRKKN